MEERIDTQAAPMTAADNVEKKDESMVDVVFDTVTAWTARSLVATKRGLEAAARWLEARAKVVGDLATKLEA
jgi:hypothetical protein